MCKTTLFRVIVFVIVIVIVAVAYMAFRMWSNLSTNVKESFQSPEDYYNLEQEFLVNLSNTIGFGSDNPFSAPKTCIGNKEWNKVWGTISLALLKQKPEQDSKTNMYVKIKPRQYVFQKLRGNLYNDDYLANKSDNLLIQAENLVKNYPNYEVLQLSLPSISASFKRWKNVRRKRAQPILKQQIAYMIRLVDAWTTMRAKDCFDQNTTTETTAAQ